MVDQQDGPKGSVPAVAQSRAKSQPSPFVTNKAWWGAAMLLSVGLVVAIVVWGVDPDPNQFLAASSVGASRVRIDSVSCVSIDAEGLVYDRKPYSDPGLTEAFAKILKIKTVLFAAADTTCRWGFSGNVVPGTITEVRYNGHFARYLISMAICEKDADGQLNSSRCITKNIYVFNPRVTARDLFMVGLVGLARPQAIEIEAFQLRKPQ